MSDMRKLLSFILSAVCVGIGITLIAREIKGIPTNDIDLYMVMFCGFAFAYDFYLRTKR